MLSTHTTPNQIDFHLQLFESLKVTAMTSKRSSNADILRIQCAANFASRFTTGYLTDFDLENELARPFKADPLLFTPASTKRKILHIATQFYPVGGHTRVVKNWLQNDINSDSKVLLTHNTPYTPDFRSYSGARVPCARIGHKNKPLQSAKNLRDEIHSFRPNYIVLHIHMDDVVPSIALSAGCSCPILFLNHADHLFSLATPWVTQIIDFRKPSIAISTRYRGTGASEYLPLPLIEDHPPISREQLRSRHGIDESTVVFVTMAQPYKYTPFGEYDFIDIWSRIIQDQPARLLMIGPSRHDVSKSEIPENLIPLGRLTNASEYLAMADYYVESFPFASGMATLDAIQMGAIPLFSPFSIDLTTTNASSLFGDVAPGFKTAELSEYKEIAHNLIRGGRRDRACPSWLDSFSGDPWRTSLDKLLESVDRRHSETAVSIAATPRTPERMVSREAENQAIFQANVEHPLIGLNSIAEAYGAAEAKASLEYSLGSSLLFPTRLSRRVWNKLRNTARNQFQKTL